MWIASIWCYCTHFLYDRYSLITPESKVAALQTLLENVRKAGLSSLGCERYITVPADFLFEVC